MKRENMVEWVIMFVLMVPHLVFALTEPVQTSCGPIVGTTFRYSNKIIQAYLGVPFVEPPVGDLRFRMPVPKKSWSQPLQATRFSPACIQHQYPAFPWVDTMPNQSEDCLYLNVWVPPNTTKNSKKAVMFWLFSGSFEFGSNRLPVYDGHVLAAEGDVLVVTINFRLGIHGFISTRTDEAPGNMGLYDMLEALKWVKCNIGAFGGDSDNITVFGQSAGGFGTGLMCLSPLAKGLFRRAILQSGSPAYLYMDHTEDNNRLAQKVAEAVGCASGANDFLMDPVGVMKCLRTIKPKELVETASKLDDVLLVGFFTIVGDEFLPEEPSVLLKTGNFNDVEVLIGHTQDEGSELLAEVEPEAFGDYGEKTYQVNKTFAAQCMRNFFKDLPDNERIVQYYLGHLQEDDCKAVYEQLYHSIGDFSLICPDTYFAESYAKKVPNVYAYYFNHIPSVTPWKPWMGSVHFDEVPFVYGRPLDHPRLYTSAERCLSKRLISIWTNFAKTGVPCVNWQKYSRKNPYFKIFNISNRKSYLESHKKNCDFFRPFFGYS